MFKINLVFLIKNKSNLNVLVSRNGRYQNYNIAMHQEFNIDIGVTTRYLFKQEGVRDVYYFRKTNDVISNNN